MLICLGKIKFENTQKNINKALIVLITQKKALLVMKMSIFIKSTHRK